MSESLTWSLSESLIWSSAMTARWHLFLISMPLCRGKSRKLERGMLLTGLPEDKTAYRNTHVEHTRPLSDTKRKYYANLFEESARDTKKLFSILTIVMTHYHHTKALTFEPTTLVLFTSRKSGLSKKILIIS
ncbi:hypothetical protein P5673_018539 [Acropora cervicornis]|uniref:Uncharacterized protein n=1 Tax=Acropora cervicornis TaxID=6130 RepID=A0AAD9QDI9_ACRCE|nr:hypothetical protein P5673_018539 [Acropora cervicornis]